MEWWQQPFFWISLPTMVAFAIAAWLQSRHDRRTSLNRRLDAIESRLDRIEGARR
ncbi:MAG TPA: hypothetical protein VGS58_09590 [Candidatus Sulfopaludibacter sp.]|nr:hypothetical protein [Candidatus Sulfopaludibacter sp.]